VSYPFIVATSYEMFPFRGGMADAQPQDGLWPQDRLGYPVFGLEVPIYVCDSWCTFDATIVDDERPGWRNTPPRPGAS
jgi:hypothetical protein